jgi:mannose-6-phosphate isomerase-like protein (cupin superfamily)
VFGQLGQRCGWAKADRDGDGPQLGEAITLLVHLDQVLLAGQSEAVSDDAEDRQRRTGAQVDGRAVPGIGQNDAGEIDDGFDTAQPIGACSMLLSWPYHAAMPTLVASPTRIQAVGNKPKMIEEYVGRVTTGHRDVSVARMLSPEGWVEPGQAPQFDEVTVVLAGCLRVTSADGELDVAAGQAVVVSAGEWVRYSTPEAEGAEYIAVCLPAFSPDLVHRDDD